MMKDFDKAKMFLLVLVYYNVLLLGLYAYMTYDMFIGILIAYRKFSTAGYAIKDLDIGRRSTCTLRYSCVCKYREKTSRIQFYFAVRSRALTMIFDATPQITLA
jgi:hypothetical protein